MHEVAIKPQWTIRAAGGAALAPRVIELLVHVHEQGSLAAACAALGVSYRHAWDLIRAGEALFGQPLVRMERGKGSTLTPLGDRLVWADRRIAARLTPLLDSLASELGAEIRKLLSSAAAPALLRIHASHGFAIETLHRFLAGAGVPSELKYCGSVEALASLHDGGCDMAGFHVPIGEFETPALAHYRPWLDARSQRLIHIATRRQGLMVARGNPKKIYALADLARPGVRFINRQPGSGTRLLLDMQLHAAGIAAARIHGYEQAEFTHAAVAAFVASGMADAGYGVETPARQFELDFIANQTERYFLLCDERSLAAPVAQQMQDILRSESFRRAVDALRGYDADGCGRIETLAEAFGRPKAMKKEKKRTAPRRAAATTAKPRRVKPAARR